MFVLSLLCFDFVLYCFDFVVFLGYSLRVFRQGLVCTSFDFILFLLLLSFSILTYT